MSPLAGDPTAIPIEHDPRRQRMSGTTVHGNVNFDVPYISHIEGRLWVGGCKNGLTLPANINHVISLYPWERYTPFSRKRSNALRSEAYAYLYDAGVPDLNHLNALVELALFCLSDGDTLIHCQAGLNRSNLLAAMVLMTGEGEAHRTAAQAIDLLREKRSPAVLCNSEFERFLRQRGAEDTQRREL